MADVFISYSREDEARARTLARHLEARGISVWWDRKIPPGKTWDEVIGKALDDARCVVVLWSTASVVSNWVKEEASRGLRRSVLIPVVFDHVDPPLGFGRIEAAQLSDWDSDERDPEFAGFVDSVQGLLRAGPDRGGAQPAQPSPGPGEGVPRPSSRRAWILAGVLAPVLAGLGMAGWYATSSSHRLELQIWNVERDDKTAVVAVQTFSATGRGGLPEALIEESGQWLVNALVPEEALRNQEVSVTLTLPENPDAGDVSLRAQPEVSVATHLYIVGDQGKQRVRLDLNRENLAAIRGEFMVEIGAPGYSSALIKAQPGTALEKTVRLRPMPVKVAIEAFQGPDPSVARRLTSRLARSDRISVFGPQALARLRAEIAASRNALGVDRVAQTAIRDALGVDFLVSGAYEKR